jgi:hypothetical protein
MTTKPSSAPSSTRFELALALSLLSAACGGAPPRGPFFGDEKLLVVGVDPDAEADAVVRQLAEHGFHEVRRLTAPTFTALGFAPLKDDPEAGRVRVVTANGLALALDSSSPTLLTQGRLIRLLDFPYRSTHDINGDGDEELFVREEPLPRGEPCLRVYRVRRTGIVEEVSGRNFVLPRPPDSTDAGWLGAAFCDADEETQGSKEPAEQAAEPVTEPVTEPVP